MFKIWLFFCFLLLISDSNWNVFVFFAKGIACSFAKAEEVEPTHTPHDYDHFLKELAMLIHDWCNWQLDLFAFWRIVTLDEKHWNIFLHAIISSLVSGSYVDLDLFWEVLCLVYWYYVDLSSSRIFHVKYWSNIDALVWIVTFLIDRYDWYLFLWMVISENLCYINILVMVLREELCYIHLVLIVPLFVNWPDVFLNLLFIPLHVKLSDIYNFRWLLI